MYLTALFLALILTVLVCVFIIFMQWIILNVGITLFVMVLLLMYAVLLLVMGEEKYDE